MERWLVGLKGKPLDLLEFARQFPTGDVHATEEEGAVYLTGSAFDGLEDDGDVRALATDRLEVLSGALGLLRPNFQRPKVGVIYRELEDGTRRGYAVGTVRVGGGGYVSAGHKRGPTQAQQLFAAACVDRHLRTATALWSDSPRTWSRLYVILEEIEQHFGGRKVHKAGLCSPEDRNRFTGSANHTAVAGREARHAQGKYGDKPPTNPMTQAEAVGFIGRLLGLALERVIATESAPPNEE